ncbi:MAG TPA: SPFH domain-containing protein [Candidatus Saccharimonadia bacterium]|jgi:regulator of protease activity HflC (stomatin/prohibitin superfamily)
MNCDTFSDYFQRYGHCPPDPSTPWWHYALMVVGGLVVLGIILSAFRIVQQYQRGVVTRFGRVVGEREPGLRLVVPLIDRMVHVDMQIFTLPLQPQQVITKDSVSLSIRAVVYYRVFDATQNYTQLDDDEVAIEQLGQSIMRRLVGQRDLAELLEHGEAVTTAIHNELKRPAVQWGLEITYLEIKDIDLPQAMQRAMAAQAEATRMADAKVTEAGGEQRSAELLAQAASQLTPAALRLRELLAMQAIGADNATVIVVPSGNSAELAGSAAAGAIAAERGQALG